MPFIERGLALQPGNWLLQWLRAKVYVENECYVQAMQIFKKLGSIDADAFIEPVAYDKRIFGASAIAEIGHCAFRMGRYRESAEWYRPRSYWLPIRSSSA